MLIAIKLLTTIMILLQKKKKKNKTEDSLCTLTWCDI